MGLDRATLQQLTHLLRPLGTRVSNAIARGVVTLTGDDTMLQLLQIGVLAGETVDNAEHHQPYGFSSVPLVGAEVVVVFPNGDRSHPLVVSTSDRRHRPVGGQGGEVVLYTDEGDTIRLGRGHVVTIATTGTVKLGSDAAAEGAIKGTSFNSAAQTFLTALQAYATGIAAIADPTGASTTTLTAAITAFKNALAAAVSAKVLVE